LANVKEILGWFTHLELSITTPHNLNESAATFPRSDLSLSHRDSGLSQKKEYDHHVHKQIQKKNK